MEILEIIINHKLKEIEGKKRIFPVRKLEKSVFFKRRMHSFYDALGKPGPSVIGEFKRKSPSKGVINISSEVEDVARAYQEAGIAAMSILTDMEFFGGEEQDLENVAGFIKIPLLRKDFILDEYQVIESKSIGASSILLIASVLTRKEVKILSELAQTLGMDVLFEVHNENDLDKMSQNIRIVGVNNRNLNTLDVDISLSEEIFPFLPVNCLKVAESGFQTPEDIKKLFETGFDAFLIGENFMKSKEPGEAASRFLEDLKILME
jgi:indole-3-glycerol phosphate synthase